MTTAEIKTSLPTRALSVPIVAGTVALAAAVAAVQPSVAATVFRFAFVIVLVPCAVIDIERRIIPNRITGPAALLAILLGLALDPAGEPGRLLWGVAAAAFLLLAALAYPAGMGMGDVKLLGVMGLFLGAPVVVALVVALLGNVITGLVLAGRHGLRKARKTGLPFGPYLAVGGITAAVVGHAILHAYVSLHH